MSLTAAIARTLTEAMSALPEGYALFHPAFTGHIEDEGMAFIVRVLSPTGRFITGTSKESLEAALADAVGQAIEQSGEMPEATNVTIG